MLTARMRGIVWVLVAELLIVSVGAFFVSPRVAQASNAQDLHAPIFIEGNDDFTASNGVTGGSGTPSDPYVITELLISASGAHGIRIENTNASFLIREVVIESGGLFRDGISLHNVTDGRVESSNVSNNRNGIQVVNSGNITLSANDLWSNQGHGIHLLSTTGAAVRNNTLIQNQDVGIWVQSSTDITITGNVASSVRRFDPTHTRSWPDKGIYLLFATRVLVRDNLVESFNREGIDIGGSREVDVVGNTLRSNGRGFTLSSNHNVTAAENVVTDNSLGLLVGHSTGVHIRGNNISKNGGDGISLSFSPGAIVRDNVLSSNIFSGIEVRSPFVLLENNTLRSNGAGITLSSTTNATLRGNHLTSNSLTFWGREMVHLSSHNIDVSNLVNGAPLRYHRDCSGLTLDGVPVGQLVVVNCTDVRISNIQITDTESAIKLVYVDGASLENSVFYANRGLGIELEWVRNATIVGNTVVLNRGGGIGLLSSSQITIVGNNVTYNGVPPFGPAGIGLKFTSDTLIYRNNMINNSKQAEAVVGMGDVWDNGYPSGGNFWSDYSGEDRCGGPQQDVCPDPDGLGDTSYGGDFGGTDNYPLMVAAGPPNTPPHADVKISPSVAGPTTIFALDASHSTDAEDIPGTLTYRWDWEGDGMWDTGFSTHAVVPHRFFIAGNHTIRLEVRDSRGATNITEGEVTVLNEPPIARIQVHREIGDTSTTFRFDASASIDHGEPTVALRVRWDWQDDGIWDTPLTLNKTAAHRYEDPGMPTVRLEVRDTGDLIDETTSIIRVLPDQPPVASFRVSPSTGDNTTIFSVDASDSFDWGNLSAPLQFRWDWEGDGFWDTPWAFEKEARHRFPLPGTYGVRLEAMDTGGLTNQSARMVHVVDIAAPLIQHVAPDRFRVGQPISITVQVTDSSANLNVTLRYRGVTDLTFTLLEMERVQDGRFHALIPPQAEAGFLRYNFAAVDESLNGRISPTFTVYVTAQLSPISMGTIALAGVGAVIFAYWLIRRTRPPSGRAEGGRR